MDVVRVWPEKPPKAALTEVDRMHLGTMGCGHFLSHLLHLHDISMILLTPNSQS